MTDPQALSEDDAALAAELALGVLDADDRTRAEARRIRDPAFDREVRRWEDVLAGLALEARPVVPPEAVWDRVRAALDPQATAANDDGRLVFWKAWAVAATGLLVASLSALAFLVAGPGMPDATADADGGTRVATLRLPDGGTALAVVYDTESNGLYVAPSVDLGRPGAVPCLWLISPDGRVTRVGTIAARAVSHRRLEATLADLADGAASVVLSMEPVDLDGETAAPVGPLVATGDLEIL